MRLAIVAAEFHREVTDRMVEKALARAKERGVRVTSVVRVPGTFEIPLAVQSLLERPDVDGAVTGRVKAAGGIVTRRSWRSCRGPSSTSDCGRASPSVWGSRDRG